MPEKNNEWFSILETLKQDNIVLKNRLSEALQKEVDHSFVEKAEFFQQLFIDNEQVLDLLRHDITAFLLSSGNANDGRDENTSPRFQLLEKDIIRIIFEFNQMKISFEQFLSE